MRLEGKVAIIVGAGQTPGPTMGNGRATALQSGPTAVVVYAPKPQERDAVVVNGRVDITFGNDVHQDIFGGTLSVTPYITGGGSIIWRCGAAAAP